MSAGPLVTVSSFRSEFGGVVKSIPYSVTDEKCAEVSKRILSIQQKLNDFELQVIHCKEFVNSGFSIDQHCSFSTSVMGYVLGGGEIRPILRAIKQVRTACDYLHEFLKVRDQIQEAGYKGSHFYLTHPMREFLRFASDPEGSFVEGGEFGEGGHSSVTALDVGGLAYAKKTFETGFHRIATGEIVSHSQVSHIPGVVPLCGVSVAEDGSLQSIMPRYFSDLAHLFFRNPVNEHACMDAAKKLIALVSSLHQHNIFHGDLKLNNILVDRNGSLRLADFGFTRNVGQPVNAGLRFYRAPERTRGAKATLAMDHWALGAMLFELLVRGQMLMPTDREVPPGELDDFVTGRFDELSATPSAPLLDPTIRIRTVARGFLWRDPKARLNLAQAHAILTSV